MQALGRFIGLGLVLAVFSGCAATGRVQDTQFSGCNTFDVVGDRVYVHRCGTKVEELQCFDIGAQTTVAYMGRLDTVRCV